uniref:Uncharacterized protein n=1 Tax=Caenorhabditis japonica TaxID=281687 RepID=A0A8R1DUM6_CAEJA
MLSFFEKYGRAIFQANRRTYLNSGTPTTIRNVFSGVVSLIGELGSIGAPYMNRLTAINKDAPAILIALMSFIAAFLVTLQPETKNKKLPEDIDDFDAGPLFRGCRRTKKTSLGSLENSKDVEKNEEEAVELLEVEKGKEKTSKKESE